MQGLLRSGLGRWTGLTLLFSAAAVVQTWPLVLHARQRIIDWPALGDSWQFLWNLWWLKHAIVEHQTNPFHTDHLFFPQGSDLYLHALTPVNGIVSIPLQLVTNNLFLSWNVLALLFLVLSGLGMYALSYRVNGNHAAALISGYIFAFSPFVLMHLQAAQANLSTTWPIPLFVLFLIRFQDTGRLREAVAAGIFWALLTYNHLEYGAWAGLFLGLFLAYWLVVYLRQRDRARLAALWRGSVVVAAVWSAASAPLLIPALLNIYSGDYFLPGAEEFWSANLVSFVTPSPLWGPGTVPVSAPLDVPHAGTVENTAYLGITPLLLAGLAVFAIRRTPHRVVFWGVVFLFFVMLSLGPYLYVGETKTFAVQGLSFSVPLPYQIYDQLPVVSVGRVPARLIVFGLIGLAVLAGTGFDLLTSWLGRSYRKLVPLAGLLIFSLVVLEYWNPPVQLSDLTIPPVMEEIGDEPGDFSVLHAPWGRFVGWGATGDFFGGPLTSYYQAIHGKPSFGGYLSRAKNSTLDWVGEEPGLHYLACRCYDRQDDTDPDLVRPVFRKYRVKYVVLHRLNPNGAPMPYSKEELQVIDEYLRAVVGLTPIYDDLNLTVYRNHQIE